MCLTGLGRSGYPARGGLCRVGGVPEQKENQHLLLGQDRQDRLQEEGVFHSAQAGAGKLILITTRIATDPYIKHVCISWITLVLLVCND